MAVQLFAVPDPTGRENNRPEHIGRLGQLQSPYQTYLERLAPTTRQSAESRLNLIANILWPGVPAPLAPWHELDADALMNLRARLSGRYRFDVAANYLAAAKGALKAAWLLGMVSTETWHRAAEVQAPKGHALPAGHWIDDGEWARLFASIAAGHVGSWGSGPGHVRGAAGLWVPAG